MIKDLKKVNSEALFKAEAKAFTELQMYTIRKSKEDPHYNFYGDELYVKMRGEWTRLLNASNKRDLSLLKVDVK